MWQISGVPVHTFLATGLQTGNFSTSICQSKLTFLYKTVTHKVQVHLQRNRFTTVMYVLKNATEAGLNINLL